MPAKRSLTLALALLLVAAIPARAAAFPAITVLDTNSGTAGSAPYTFAAFNDYLYYAATNSAAGYELWRTDGTVLGTTLVKDIRSGADSSSPSGFTALNGYLYFRADDGVNGTEVWRTDGTTLGTTLVEDININVGGSSYPGYFTALGNYLYFGAADDDTGYDLWRVDGSGLTESSSIPGTNAGIGCECFPVLNTLNGRLFMAMYSDETGSELAYLDEPTFGLPGTNRDGSVWSTALVLLAAVTAVAGVGLRMRGAPRS